jgi:hypothetical protein
MGLPGYVRHATNTWTVTSLGPGRSRVAVDARMGVSGPARLAAPLIWIALTAVRRRTLRDLKRHVEGAVPAGNERRPRETTRRAGSGGEPPAPDGGRLLATAISANAVFSMLSGLALVGGAVVLAAPTGVPARALAGIGAGVVGFGVLLLWLLTDSTRLTVAGRVAVAADLVWITAAATVATTPPARLTTAGTATLGALTAAVAAFATVQAVGQRRTRGASATGTTALSVSDDRLLAASPAAVWDAVADASGYARFAAGIAATEIVSGGRRGHGARVHRRPRRPVVRDVHPVGAAPPLPHERRRRDLPTAVPCAHRRTDPDLVGAAGTRRDPVDADLRRPRQTGRRRTHRGPHAWTSPHGSTRPSRPTNAS